ncbi:MAG: ADP-ribosylglycohydrolase family protein [Clostridia bacterium]|nr:ADP-ribosylglycohydrolase family protein [Clostridia bacterium]
MLGAIIGDIAGSRYEFNNIKTKNFKLLNMYCDYTDDTVMTVAVTKTLLECGHGADEKTIFYHTVKNMQDLGIRYPNRGYGGQFAQWLESNNPKPYNSCGNGAGMRISPVGFFAETEEELKLYSKAVTETTHNHKEGIKAAEAVAMAIFMAKQSATKDEIKKRMSKDYYPELTTEKTSYEFLLKNYGWDYGGNGELAQYSTPQAIACFMIGKNFEDVIKTCVSIGGDSDTIAAMAGGIAEAYYGIDLELKKYALHYLPTEFKDILTDFNKKYICDHK